MNTSNLNTSNLKVRNLKISKQLALVAGVIGVALLTGGRSAAATDEFPANPSVEISMTCSATEIGDVLVTYKNDGGLADAEFDTVIDGIPRPHISLDAAIWVDIHYSLPEGSPGVIVISAPEMNTVTTTVGPIDCLDATLHTEVVCVDGVPTMSITATNTGKVVDIYSAELLGAAWSSSEEKVDIGASYTWTHPLSDGVEDIASLYSINTGLIDSQAGSAVCTLPTTTVPETVPETIPDTVPDTIPDTVAPTTAPPTDPAPTTTAAVRSTDSSVIIGGPDPVQLPQTGTPVGVLALTAAGFVVTGWLLRRSASA